jgi:signal transduction histidine kinase
MSTPTRDQGFGTRHASEKLALRRFILAGTVALLFLTVGTVLLASQISKDLALRHAQSRGTTFARAVGGPLVDDDLRRGDPDALRSFTELMGSRFKDRSIEHIKVWDRSGRVLWSDEPTLSGRVFALDRSVQRLFDTGGTVASASDLHDEENVLDRTEAPLLEVYAGTRDADGVPVVVESYWATDEIDQDAHMIMLRLGVLPLGALLLFAAVLLPLVYSFARHVARAQAESRRSLLHALAAADLERRRIVRDLHDGVMQDVGGAGYALDAAARSLPEAAVVPRRLIAGVASSIQHVGESLRFLVADIYPPNLARDGLLAAVTDLADRSARQGLVVDVDADGPDLADLPLEVVQLCYRVTREALRNVQRHAEASEACVHLSWGADAVTVAVTDDGRGLPHHAAGEPGEDRSSRRDGPPAEGEHLGLRLLDDTLRDVGGSLHVESPRPGATSGTVLTAIVPRQVVQA